MKIKTSHSVGHVVYEMFFEERTTMDTMHNAIVLSNPPKICDCCKNVEHFRMDSNKDKEGNTYVNVVCRKCGAKAKLGQYKAGGFFWHKFEVYVPKQQQETPTSTQSTIANQGQQNVDPEFAF